MSEINSAFVEELYYNYLRDPQSVSKEWQEYFSKKSPIIPKITEKQGTTPSFQSKKIPENVEVEVLSSISAKIVENMQSSIEVPTATSVRTIPVKLLDENRQIINKHLQNIKRKKTSFTHILAWALVKALMKYPQFNSYFDTIDGKPCRIKRKHINLGLAIDLERKDGSRLLLVPNIKNCEQLTFSEFIEKYDEIIEKARNNKLDLSDLENTSVTLTNPGMIGTTHSNPRLMKGQGVIVATGSIDYPTEFQAVNPAVLTDMAISKVVTITSTYDHRIIQGAESAEFLSYISKLLLGKEHFYDQIFYSLDVPFEPLHWQTDIENKSSFPLNIDEKIEKNAHIMLLINAYRVRGHLLASSNPLGKAIYYYPELDPAYYGLTIWDLDRYFHADDSWEKNYLSFREIFEILRTTYCGRIGYEFMHIQDPEKKEWIKTKLETQSLKPKLSSEEKVEILKKIVDAEFFENFLHTKYIGHKRFSLEGGESLIVLINTLFEKAADHYLHSVVIGMAHRGRLNVLVNNVGKKPEFIFNEFDGDYDPELDQAAGDVKYHLGDKGKFVGRNGHTLEVLLSPNPSHLELVDPVICGMARAIDNKINDQTYSKALPINIHGDAAFAGQGIVAETLNLSQLEGYKVGGTIHIIVNNQIGFTTPADAARSTFYATDIAKMIQTPILHVNGNDPEAVVEAAIFAIEYRQQFKSDVIIDLLCYRKYGHNEGDEPTYTQPLLYKKIKSMPPISKFYQNELIRDKIISSDFVEKYHSEIKTKLEEAYNNRIIFKGQKKFEFYMKEGRTLTPYFTAISEEILKEITNALTTFPEHFNLNPKLKSLLQKRKEMVFTGDGSIDWAMAEGLAFGSILVEGRDVRFSGQDSRRGTFSQRHAVYYDYLTEDIYIPLNHIRKTQGKLRIFDSPLSEMAVLGYEYGYSIIADSDLTLWEAQFGDFANNAQTFFDQYLSCGEVKWGQNSNLVVLLPHGYDGQGSEHSSARLERYLQLCADENMIVGNFTTPANYFHALRRQLLLTHKLPLILMTPKSMLRHPFAISRRDEFVFDEFKHIIDDEKIEDKKKIERVLICTGKIYYELLEEKIKRNIDKIAIIRIEQLYPLHKELLEKFINSYENAKEIFWVQEEPQNMGAYPYLFPIFIELIDNFKHRFKYIGRKSSAATATGSYKRHLAEQHNIIEDALSLS